MNHEIVEHRAKTLTLTNTVSTRKYPFTQETLDQIKDLREQAEDEIYAETGDNVTVPAPIIIAEAVDTLHKQKFNKE